LANFSASFILLVLIFNNKTFSNIFASTCLHADFSFAILAFVAGFQLMHSSFFNIYYLYRKLQVSMLWDAAYFIDFYHENFKYITTSLALLYAVGSFLLTHFSNASNYTSFHDYLFWTLIFCVLISLCCIVGTEIFMSRFGGSLDSDIVKVSRKRLLALLLNTFVVLAIYGLSFLPKRWASASLILLFFSNSLYIFILYKLDHVWEEEIRFLWPSFFNDKAVSPGMVDAGSQKRRSQTRSLALEIYVSNDSYMTTSS